MKIKTPPKFFGITLDETLDSVTERFFRAGDCVEEYCDDVDAVLYGADDLIKSVRRCSIAIVDSFVEIIETEKNDAVDLDELALEVGSAISKLASFTNELMLIALIPIDDRLVRLNALTKDICCFDDTYIAELRHYLIEKNVIKLFGFPLVKSRDKVFSRFMGIKDNCPIKVLRANAKLDDVLEESLDLLVMYTTSLRDSFLAMISTEDLNPEQFNKIRKGYVAVDIELRSLLGRLDTINREMGKAPIANYMTNSFMQDLYFFDVIYISPIREYLIQLQLY